jgi:hypothetical protein
MLSIFKSSRTGMQRPRPKFVIGAATEPFPIANVYRATAQEDCVDDESGHQTRARAAQSDLPLHG